MNEETNLQYDIDAVQKISVGGGAFAVVKPYSDEMYLENRREFVETVNEALRSGEEREPTQEEIKRALLREEALANKLIETLEGYTDLPADWRDLTAIEDKQYILRRAHNFVIDEDEGEMVFGKTRVLTACYFNDKVANQTHILRRATIDDSSRYAQIQSKQYKPLKSKKFGHKTSVEFVPQDEAKAELYDSMLESVEGFAGNKVPLRVKVLVIDHVFAPLEIKK